MCTTPRDVFRYYAECACIRPGDALPAPLSLATRRTTGPTLWQGVLLSLPPQLYIGARHTPDEWGAYLRKIDQLQGRRRVWILSSHWASPEEQRMLTTLLPEHLNRAGASGRLP